jgi:hypothetical protein
VTVLTWAIATNNGAFALAIAAFKIGVRAGANQAGATSKSFALATASFKIGVRVGTNQAGAASKCIISVHVVDTNHDHFTALAMGYYYVGFEYRGSGLILFGRRIRELLCYIAHPPTEKFRTYILMNK